MPTRHPVGENDTHWCPDCKLFKTRDKFCKNALRWNGLQLYCTHCQRIRHAEWRRKKGIPDRAKYDSARQHPPGLCSRCKEFKPLWMFGRHARSTSGRDYVCKTCYRAKKIREWWVVIKGDPERHAAEKKRSNSYMKEYRKHVALSPEKKRRKAANQMVAAAVAGGYLKKLPCHECGEIKTEAHHPDYDKPLDVIWLCREHHNIIHTSH